MLNEMFFKFILSIRYFISKQAAEIDLLFHVNISKYFQYYIFNVCFMHGINFIVALHHRSVKHI